MTLRAVEDPEPCDCCPRGRGERVEWWRGMSCTCVCHHGPPLTPALLMRTYHSLLGRSHLVDSDDLPG